MRPEGAPWVHERALVESDQIGEGTAIYAFAHVMAGAVIGRDCKIGDHVFVESGVIIGDNVTVKNGVSIWAHVHIGDNVFLGPNVALTNDRYPRRGDTWQPVETWIEEGVTIGANATVVCGVRLGRRCFVGAGAVVTRDVAPYALATRNPARRRGWVCHCGRPLGADVGPARCGGCGRQWDVSATGIGERP
jgi:acetyltransferase-like isoleucine patch superfamily enzyme